MNYIRKTQTLWLISYMEINVSLLMGMNKLLLFIFIFCTGCQALSQQSSLKFSNEIVSNNSTHIARITKDSIIVIRGTTYSFTVDTPEDSGLVSINTTVKQLVSQIKSKDGSVQQYSVTDKSGTIKDSGQLLTGDKLLVTSEDNKTKKIYTIVVVPMAIKGQLQLEKSRLTVQTNSNLTLYLPVEERLTFRITITRSNPLDGRRSSCFNKSNDLPSGSFLISYVPTLLYE